MLTPRLAAAFECGCRNIENTAVVADIGTDHAYIPIELIKSGKINYAIACDINAGPLAIARQNVEKYSLADKISLRLGSGLSPLSEGEADVCIIAGMGGILISDILEADEKKAHAFSHLVLQPMNAQSELRKYLLSHDYKIENETLASEGRKVYNIITAVWNGTNSDIDEFESHIPKILEQHPLFPMLIAKKKREFTKILSGLKRAENKDFSAIEYYDKLYSEISKYKL